MYITVGAMIGAWQILQKQDKNILYYYCAQRPYSLFIKKYTKNKLKNYMSIPQCSHRSHVQKSVFAIYTQFKPYNL